MMLAKCEICGQIKQCSYVKAVLCSEHYLTYNDIVKQNKTASGLVTDSFDEGWTALIARGAE